MMGNIFDSFDQERYHIEPYEIFYSSDAFSYKDLSSYVFRDNIDKSQFDETITFKNDRRKIKSASRNFTDTVDNNDYKFLSYIQQQVQENHRSFRLATVINPNSGYLTNNIIQDCCNIDRYINQSGAYKNIDENIKGCVPDSKSIIDNENLYKENKENENNETY